MDDVVSFALKSCTSSSIFPQKKCCIETPTRKEKKIAEVTACTVSQFKKGKTKLTDESDQIPRSGPIHLGDQLGGVVRGSSKPLNYNDAGVRTSLPPPRLYDH